MVTSIRKLKLHVEVASVQMRLQLISNRSLKDLRHVRPVRHRAVVSEDLGVHVWLLVQGVNDRFFECPWHSARF